MVVWEYEIWKYGMLKYEVMDSGKPRVPFL